MKKALIGIATISFLLLSYSFSGSQDKTCSLTIEVDHLRNSKGVVQFALYNREGSIPDEHYKNQFKMGWSKIVNGKAIFIFPKLPKGKYAVNVLHDENGNRIIDKGLILPIEGIGFSNYQSIGLTNRPDFSKASFELSTDKKISVKVIYL